jgi:putative redox protein
MTNGTLLSAAYLESGEPPHRQSIRIGHHTVVSDEPAANGGGDTGPSPTGLVLAGLVACTSITLRMYADRKGWTLGQIHVEARMMRDESGEGTRIDRVVRVAAPLSDEQKRRLAEIADKTPVTKTLARATPITTTFA